MADNVEPKDVQPKAIDRISFWTERLWRPMQYFLAITAVAGFAVVISKDYIDRKFFKLEIAARAAHSAFEASQEEASILRNDIEALRSSLQRASDRTQKIDGRSITCPDGYFLVAISFQDQSGLAHGALWGPSATCAKLNVGAAAK